MEPKRLFLGLMILCTATLFWAELAEARPSTSQCRKLWKANKGERVLSCTARSGSRMTRQMSGRRYLYTAGICWDYDVVVQQACGCRKFKSASICCWKRNRSRCPDFRVGSSSPVPCKRYGAPRFGNSGNALNARCLARKRQQAQNAICKDPKVRAVAVDYCKFSIAVRCQSQAQYNAFLTNKCGPAVGDCPGCKLLKACSSKEGLACYRKRLAKKNRKRPQLTAADAAALMERFSRALKQKNQAAFQALWDPKLYHQAPTDSWSGAKFYSYLISKGAWIQTIPGRRLRLVLSTTNVWYVPCLYHTAKGPDTSTPYVLVGSSGGKLSILGIAHRTNTLNAIGYKWSKQHP